MWNTPCFIINCEHDTERRDITDRRVREVGFTNIEFFKASDGYILPQNVFTEESIFLDGLGERGVALSHKRLWKKIVEEDIERAIIFEDDITFHPEFKQEGSRLWNQIPKDGMIYMGHCCMYLGNGDRREPKIGFVEGMPLAIHSYVITKKAAKWFLDHFGECRENIDIHMKNLYYSLSDQRDWTSYAWWNGYKTCPLQHQIRFNVYFNGFCYQDHNIKLSIHRDRN